MTDELTPATQTTDDAGAQDGPTKAELLEHARELNIEGRTKMDRDELAAAIDAEEARIGGHLPAAPAPADSDTPVAPSLEPSPADVVGRPPLASLAQERAANRNPRVIGAP